MTTPTIRLGATGALLLGLALTGCDSDAGGARAQEAPPPSTAAQPFPVAGSGVHYASRAIIHSQEPTANGMVQQSSDYIELSGDLEGVVLFRPTSVIDHANGTIVNTGIQLFSGTVAGSEPVLLYDDAFRFEIDLNAGATTGVAYLGRSKDAPDQARWFECDLTIVGVGVTPEGDNLSDYSGTCTPRGTLL